MQGYTGEWHWVQAPDGIGWQVQRHWRFDHPLALKKTGWYNEGYFTQEQRAAIDAGEYQKFPGWDDEPRMGPSRSEQKAMANVAEEEDRHGRGRGDHRDVGRAQVARWSRGSCVHRQVVVAGAARERSGR